MKLGYENGRETNIMEDLDTLINELSSPQKKHVPIKKETEKF
jgi:hypothetical protein